MNNKTKKRLIEDVVRFSEEELGLKFGKSFLSRQGLPFYFVYVSEKNNLQIPIKAFMVGKSKLRFRTYCSAFLFQKSLQIRNFDTMIYKCYAHSQELSKALFNFSAGAVTQVLFHEIFHNHILGRIEDRHSNYEESFADAIGYLGAIEFSKRTSLLNTDFLLESENAFEKVSLFIKKSIDNVREKKIGNNFYFDAQKNLEKITSGLDDYQIQRFNYKFNNSFLVRCEPYCYNYSSNKDVLLNQDNLFDWAKASVKYIRDDWAFGW